MTGEINQLTRIDNIERSSPAEKLRPAVPEVPEPGPTKDEDQVDRKAVGERDLAEVITQLNDRVQSVSRQLQFSVDNDSGRTVIRVLDADTGELIRQIPPEEFMSIADKAKNGELQLIREQV